MTISVANTANTNTVKYWRNRTNEIADALSNRVLTTDSNTTNGNCLVNGSIQVTKLVTNTVGGGTISLAGNLSFSTNASFTDWVSLGLGSKVILTVGNSTHRVVLSNSVNSTLHAGKIALASDVSDANVSSPANNDVMTWRSSESAFKNVPAASLTVNNSTNFAGQPASYYANATNLTSGTLPAARLTGSYANITLVGTLSALVVNAAANVAGLNSSANVSVSASVSVTNSVFVSQFVGVGGVNSSNVLNLVDVAAVSNTLGGSIRIRGSNNNDLADFIIENTSSSLKLKRTEKNAVANSSTVFAAGHAGVITFNDSTGNTGTYLRSFGSNAAASWSQVNSADISDSTAAGRNMMTAVGSAGQTALLDNFTGDSGSGGIKGMVPAPSAGYGAASRILCATGNWILPYNEFDRGTLTVNTAFTRNESAIPSDFKTILRCDNSEGGYDVGDYVWNATGITYGSNSSKTYAVIGSSVTVKHKTTFADFTINPNRWSVIFRIYN